MRYAWLLLLVGCTPAVADVDRPGIIAELATHTACILFDLPDAPTPDVPIEGCVDGCTCNGTGREKTGDGLSTVDCRCPDGCDCKAASKQETPTPVAETVADPPLVPVAPKRSVVRMSGSRWTFEGYGTDPPPAVKAQHLAEDHGIDATGMTSAEMSAVHDNAHNYGDAMAYGVIGAPTSSCPGGTCPTPSSGTVYRRGLFGRRR